MPAPIRLLKQYGSHAPGDVTDAIGGGAADILVRTGRAEWVEPPTPPEKPAADPPAVEPPTPPPTPPAARKRK